MMQEDEELEAAISAEVKEVRRAIAAIHRMGFRFVPGSIHRSKNLEQSDSRRMK